MSRTLSIASIPLALGAVAALAAPAGADANVDPRIVDAIHHVKPADYPDANVANVISDQAVVYQTDGQFTNTNHIARLVLTPAGKSEVSSMSLDYTKDAERMEVVQAQVVKADGSVVPVTDKDIQDTEQTGDMNIYDPEGRAKKLTIPNLAVGDVVDVTYRLTRALPTRVGFFNDTFAFRSSEPLLSSSYNVDAPASLPLTAEIYHRERAGTVKTTQSRVGDRIHYAWSVEHEPVLVPEPSMNFTNEIPMLVVSTDPSWQHFSAWWAELTKPQLEATPDIKAKVAELTKDAKTDDEKIRALYDFVAQDIRYRGLGVGPRTGYTPRKASETLASRWGVCRDVSILLTSMLRESGFDAYPVITNMGDPVLPKIAYDGFNHAIVAMRDKHGGAWTFLDPTAKNNSDLLPGYEAEQNVLVAIAPGAALATIPAIEPAHNLGHATATTTIHDDGSMRASVKFETKGMFDLVVRSVAVMMSQDQQREVVERVLHHAMPDAKLVSLEMSSAAMLAKPMEIDLVVDVPNAAPKAGDLRLARTLVTSGALGLVEAAMPMLVGALPTRHFGLDAHMTFEYDEDETITVPEQFRIAALPNAAKTTSKVVAVDASCSKRDATTVTCHRGFQLKSRFIDSEQYKTLRAAIAALGQIAHQPIILSEGK
jgi:transglutaminase-like putative cysteine protease